MEGVFFEMDSFADAVVLYCQKHLANWDNAQQSEAGMESGNGLESSQERRPSEEKLCTIVSEQWRRSAAALARSRCVKGVGGAEATEQREVSEKNQKKVMTIAAGAILQLPEKVNYAELLLYV